jgi:hypothetical protein
MAKPTRTSMDNTIFTTARDFLFFIVVESLLKTEDGIVTGRLGDEEIW